jgi:hypothetical protein
MDVAHATTSFVRAAQKNEPKYPQYSAGQLAQSVQRSGYPDRYDQHEKDARALLAQVGGIRSVTGMGSAPTSAGGLTGAVQGISDALGSAAGGVTNIGALATQLAKLALPTNAVRAFAGGAGLILIFLGLILIGKEVRK